MGVSKKFSEEIVFLRVSPRFFFPQTLDKNQNIFIGFSFFPYQFDTFLSFLDSFASCDLQQVLRHKSWGFALQRANNKTSLTSMCLCQQPWADVTVVKKKEKSTSLEVIVQILQWQHALRYLMSKILAVYSTFAFAKCWVILTYATYRRKTKNKH